MTDIIPEKIKENDRLIEELEPIVKALEEFYTPTEIVVWLTSEQFFWKDNTALDLIKEGRAKKVEEIIQAMKDCVYL